MDQLNERARNKRTRRPFVTPCGVCVCLSSASWFDGRRFGSLSPTPSVQLQAILPPPPAATGHEQQQHTLALQSVSSSSYNSFSQFVSFLYPCVYLFHDRIRNGKFQITRSLIFSHCLQRESRGEFEPESSLPIQPPVHISSLLHYTHTGSSAQTLETTISTENCEYPNPLRPDW